MRIQRIDSTAAPDPVVEGGLANLLLDCVQGGASVGFLADVTMDNARAWWRRRLSDASVLVWVALDGDLVLGTVSLQPASYPNSPHRGDVSKLLVRRDARGRGIASALMAELTAHSCRSGRTLLVLDTETGSPAEAMYEKWGWERIGRIDDLALDPAGALRPTTILVKRLSRDERS